MAGALGADAVPAVGTAAGILVDLRDLSANAYGLVTTGNPQKAADVLIDTLGLVPVVGGGAKAGKLIAKVGRTLRREAPQRALSVGKRLIDALPGQADLITKHFFGGEDYLLAQRYDLGFAAEVQNKLPRKLSVKDVTEIVRLVDGDVVLMRLSTSKVQRLQTAGKEVPKLSKEFDIGVTAEVFETASQARKAGAINRRQEFLIRTGKAARSISESGRLTKQATQGFIKPKIVYLSERQPVLVEVRNVKVDLNRQGVDDAIGAAHIVASHPVGPQYKDIPLNETVEQIRRVQQACQRQNLKRVAGTSTVTTEPQTDACTTPPAGSPVL